MEYSEEAIEKILADWKSEGYTDTIVIDHGMFYATETKEYFPVSKAREDNRVHFYDENMSGPAWSMHAITLHDRCKGIILLGGGMYAPWELTSEMRTAFAISPYYETHSLLSQFI